MKLTVSNFQIHQKPKTVEIPEGETTYLEGDSDIGKSALMRAMRWVGENKPDGGSFVTFKQPRGTTSVVTLEADGHTVTRERGKSKNLYKLDDETFEAFGRSVPEPIAKFLNLSPYAFQCQGEVPFLIGATPTDAAKILSDACGLGVIDTAVQFVRAKKAIAEADIRKSEILLESAQSRLATATEQLPLADALEKAVRLWDDKEELSENVVLLSNAIDEEPEGTLLDVEVATRHADAARAAAGIVTMLVDMITALRHALSNEPTGTVVDISTARPAAARAATRFAEMEMLHARAVVINRQILDVPKGALVDVSAVAPRLASARILGEWIADVTKSAESMRRALLSEPQGEARDMTKANLVLIRALATFEEAAMLDKMVKTMRATLQSEPTAELMDTSELLKQRAQIKVCSQCGREL